MMTNNQSRRDWRLIERVDIGPGTTPVESHKSRHCLLKTYDAYGIIKLYRYIFEEYFLNDLKFQNRWYNSEQSIQNIYEKKTTVDQQLHQRGGGVFGMATELHL